MTDPFLWLALSGSFAGLALAWATRWKAKSRRWRAWLVPWGFNFAIAAFLGAVLVSGTGGNGVGSVPWDWALVWSSSLGVSLLVFRFPRLIGLPSLALTLVAGWYLWSELKDFAPVDNASRVAEVRWERETAATRTFEIRLPTGSGTFTSVLRDLPAGAWPLAVCEVLTLPSYVPWPVKQFVRFEASPAATVWGSRVNTVPPPKPERLVPYRLELTPSAGRWLEAASALEP